MKRSPRFPLTLIICLDLCQGFTSLFITSTKDVCTQYLVSGVPGVTDAALTASSSRHNTRSRDNYGPVRARLNATAYIDQNGAYPSIPDKYVCTQYLVSGVPGVTDAALTASSSRHNTRSRDNYGPVRARLNATAYIDQNGAYPSIPDKYVCTQYLVSGVPGVTDAALTASSSRHNTRSRDNYGPVRARLNATAYIDQNGVYQRGAWSAQFADIYQFIQVEFPAVSAVRGVVIKGRNVYAGDGCCYQRVTHFKVLYSLDGKRWDTVQNRANADVYFQGNVDQDSPVVHMLECPVLARFVRINPQTWFGHISLRFDVIGCALATRELLALAADSKRKKIVLKNGCVDFCWGKPNGYYQACSDCEKYVTCANSYLFQRPCPAFLRWDDNLKKCLYNSQTCYYTF